MENKNTGLKVLVAILIILVLSLGGFIVYDKFINTKPVEKIEEKEEKEETEVEEKKTYDYSTVKGVYTFKGSEDANGDYDIYILSLNEDGVYHYQAMRYAERGTIGNYVIVNDEIHLNQLFFHGSDAALTIETGNKVLKINSKDEIIDESPEQIDNTISDSYDKITLKRDTSIQMTDFENYFNNLEIFNNAHQK